VLPKKWNSKYFSPEENFLSVKKQKSQKAKRNFYGQPLQTRPEKGLMKFFEPNNLKQGQISEIWPEKGQPGNPALQGHGECY